MGMLKGKDATAVRFRVFVLLSMIHYSRTGALLHNFLLAWQSHTVLLIQFIHVQFPPICRASTASLSWEKATLQRQARNILLMVVVCEVIPFFQVVECSIVDVGKILFDCWCLLVRKLLALVSIPKKESISRCWSFVLRVSIMSYSLEMVSSCTSNCSTTWWRIFSMLLRHAR